MHNLRQLERDLRIVTNGVSSFGKGSIFGNSKITNNDLNKIEQEIKPENKGRIKRALYNLLKKSGVKVGEYADHTFKQILSMTVRFLGPIVLMAILFRYRGTVKKILFSKKDQERLDSAAQGVSDVANSVKGQFKRN
jgi:hypothetical protein